MTTPRTNASRTGPSARPWQSTLTVLYPKRNFSDRAETDFILKQVAAPEDLVIGDFALDTTYVGKDVGQIAAIRKSDPATTLMALIAESQARQSDESVVAKGMDERDIASIMRWKFTNICSDGALDGAHPRGFGSFPRVLGHYVRELKEAGVIDVEYVPTEEMAADCLTKPLKRQKFTENLKMVGLYEDTHSNKRTQPHAEWECCE